MPDSRHGFTVWLTGLSGAGKTTLGDLVAADLEARGRFVERLDADLVRESLCRDLGYSKADRDTNVHRIGWVASRLTRAGAVVVVSVISPYAQARERARSLVESHGVFVEVHIAASLETCRRRDPKGLYARAARGELADFTGVSAPYEVPVSPDICVDTDVLNTRESVVAVVSHLEALGLLTSIQLGA